MELTEEERRRLSRPSFRMSGAGGRRPQGPLSTGLQGAGEAAATIGSAVLGSVPAGLAGLAALPFKGPQGAAGAVEDVQEALTYVPRTQEGVKAIQSAVGPLSAMGAPAEYIGEKTREITGSPALATAAEVVLDPLNLIGSAVAGKAAASGARAVGRAGQTLGRELGPKAAEMAEGYMRRAGLAPSITEGVGYGTRQEGPFYRVAPSDPELARFAHRGIREAPGEGAEALPGGTGGQLPQPVSDESVRQTLADPGNFVMQAANRYAREKTGQDYVLPKIPESSLVKQSPIGRVFQLGATDDPAYKSAVFESYGRKFPQLIEQTGAKNYDQLLEAAYKQLAKETKQQFESLPVNMSFHRAGEGNYLSSGDMLKDVYGNRHLYVFQGGDPHQFLNEVDPKTGLNSNEMFRAVHDFYGHAIHGNQFGPKGEEIAYAAHSQMFSPLARLAMATETRGQNSVVNYTPLNAALKARISKLDEIEYEAKRRRDVAAVRDVQAAKRDAWSAFQFAPQKGLLLPPEFLDVQFAGGMPDYIQPLIRPEAGTAVGSELVHFSKAPGLTQTDPRRYGQGIKGEEAERLSYAPGAVKERTYFYAGEPGAVTPEPGLGPYRYRARSEQLYDVGADPLELRTLAAESSRTPFTAKYNPGMQSPEQAITDVERMVKEYGYEGMVNPKLSKPTAIMYRPTAVQPFAGGGAVGGNNMNFAGAADEIARKLVSQGMSQDQAMMLALRMSDARMKAGGAVMMAGGGLAKGAARAIAKAAEKAGMAKPVTATKDLTTVEDFHRSLMDRVKQAAADRTEAMTAFDYKYDKGQRVFTSGSAQKNMPPYVILGRTLVGNAPMKVDPKNPLSKSVIDPATGKAKRTPYEPGYRVRMERGPDDWYEVDLPESQIIGEVEMAGGGFLKGAARAAERAAEKGARAAEQAQRLSEMSPMQRNAYEVSRALAEQKTPITVKPDTVQRMMEERAAQIMQANPKLTEEAVAARARRDATRQLKWERQGRERLQKRYGELSPSRYDMPAQRKLRNLPGAVDERVQKAQEFLSRPTPPWEPPKAELQAFDRNLIKDALEGFPGIDQTRFPRYEAPRAQTGYIDEIYDDPRNRELIKQQIKRGLPLGGETFYASLYPVKVAAMERGIPAEKFDRFVYETAPASARNSIMNEMAVGQFMRDMKARGLPLDEQTVKEEMARFKQRYGTGLPLMPVHREGVRTMVESGANMRDMLKADIPTNYKIPTYGTQKAGDFGKSMVLDVHEAAGQTQGSRFHPYFTEQGGFGPTEYGLAEGKMLDIAKELGIPGGMAQAGRWFGGGELTGLKSPRGDALDLLEKQAAYTLQGQGINPTPKAVRDYILNMVETGEGVLMPYFKSKPMPDYRTKKAEGGEVKAPLSAMAR